MIVMLQAQRSAIKPEIGTRRQFLVDDGRAAHVSPAKW